MVDELQLHRAITQYTNPHAPHAPDDHEGNVQAITVRLVYRSHKHRPPLPKLDLLAVDADEEPQVEWEAEDDVKGNH